MKDMMTVEVHTKSIPLAQGHMYSREELIELIDSVLSSARDEGLLDARVSISSAMEPYEDFLGDAVMTPCGWRAKTPDEVEEDNLWSVATELSLEFPGYPYATDVFKILKKGKTVKQVREFYGDK
jgi:hypothetical protein